MVAVTSLSGVRVARELEALIARRGKRATIVSDNGTELTSNTVLGLRRRDADRLALHCPEQPDADAFTESFYGWLRDELLNETLFCSLSHAGDRGGVASRVQLNRPDLPVGWLTPAELRRHLQPATESGPVLNGQLRTSPRRSQPTVRIYVTLDRSWWQHHRDQPVGSTEDYLS